MVFFLRQWACTN